MNDRVYDDQGGAQGFLKEGVLPPNGVFAEVPAMVAPDYDEGIFTESKFVEAVDNFTNLGICVAYTGSIVFTDCEGKGGIRIRIFPPAVVFHEFARAVPGCLAFGLLGMWDRRELGILVVLHIFGGCAKGEVGTCKKNTAPDGAQTVPPCGAFVKEG